MATVRILLGIICLAFAGGFVKSAGDILGVGDWKVERLESLNVAERATKDAQRHKVKGLGYYRVNHETASFSTLSSTPKRKTINEKQILTIAKSQLGTREATGNNDGLMVEKYLAYTGNKRGEPWCASFVSWVFGQAGFEQPKTAWSPALFPRNRQVALPKPAAVFGIYFPKLKRVGHCGLVAKIYKNWVYTIEGNTNPAGSREGDGVYQRIRHQRNISVYADWLSEKGSWP